MYHNNYHHRPEVRAAKNTSERKSETGSWFSKKGLWFLGILIFVGSIFWILKPVLAILAASLGISYILLPTVEWCEKKGLPRERSVVFTFLLCVCSLTLLGLLIVPPILIQFDTLAAELTTRIQNLGEDLGPLLLRLENLIGREIPVDFENIRLVAIDFIKTHAPQVQDYIKSIGGMLLTQGLGLMSTVLNLVLLPIFVFYICRDREKLTAGLYTIIPKRFHSVVDEAAGEVDTRLSAFIKAQLTVCICSAVLYTVGLSLVGIKLALPIGVLSGILYLIPYVGTAIGLLASLTICLIDFGFSWHLLAIAVVYVVVSNIENFVLVPHIVGDKVGLSPMVVMIALIVGGSLMGVWGMVLAIPITAILSVISSRWIDSYRESEFYKR